MSAGDICGAAAWPRAARATRAPLGRTGTPVYKSGGEGNVRALNSARRWGAHALDKKYFPAIEAQRGLAQGVSCQGVAHEEEEEEQKWCRRPNSLLTAALPLFQTGSRLEATWPRDWSRGALVANHGLLEGNSSMASSTWKTPFLSLCRLLRRFEAWDSVRTAVGLVLLLGSAAKLHQLVFDRASLAIQGGLLASKWVVIVVVEVEMFLGVCLLLNLWRRATWAATLILFGIFSVYSASKTLAGEPCSCFGAAGKDVPAWVMMILDLTAIAALCSVRPSLRIGNRRIGELEAQSHR